MSQRVCPLLPLHFLSSAQCPTLAEPCHCLQSEVFTIMRKSKSIQIHPNPSKSIPSSRIRCFNVCSRDKSCKECMYFVVTHSWYTHTLKRLPMPGMVSAMEPGNVPGHPYPPTKHFHRPLGRTTTWLDLWLVPTCLETAAIGFRMNHASVHKANHIKPSIPVHRANQAMRHTLKDCRLRNEITAIKHRGRSFKRQRGSFWLW